MRAALDQTGTAAIAGAARQGGDFSCGEVEDPTPLDRAIIEDDLERVRALLEARADPDARWTVRGDRFPLQSAIDNRAHYGRRGEHRSAIVELLLRHGADPNARWCPYESRQWSKDYNGCNSDQGMTPLIEAAGLDQLGSVRLLLDAGADPRQTNWLRESALEVAHSEAVFSLVLTAQFPVSASRDRAALNYLDAETPGSGIWLDAGPWHETALTRAIYSSRFSAIPPPPPPPPDAPPVPPSNAQAERVQILLRMGAAANQRLTWSNVDWTPLALAIRAGDARVIEMLLGKGADPNARWCVSLHRESPKGVWPRYPGCTSDKGMTPLMWAASLGRVALVSMLVEKGADPAARDWQGRSALDHAPVAQRRTFAAALGRD